MKNRGTGQGTGQKPTKTSKGILKERTLYHGVIEPIRISKHAKQTQSKGKGK